MTTGKEQDSLPLPRPFGPYTLLKLLARGGMGEIYLARTTGLADFEKYYAIKKLLAKYAKDPDVTMRFVDEAKLGARLGHPNIVQVYDLGKITEELYMATEFVDGFDLRRILRFCHEKTKRIPVDIALFIVREVLSGLAYAHRQVDAQGRPINLVHRDISPQNVLVSFEGEVKIIDFGLAKSTQRSQETQANVLLGNFGYMSPEQARGKKLDVRTDIYSTGVVLFELVTGTKRFMDENPLLLLEKVANPQPVPPSERAPGVPEEVDRICLKATHANPDERYTDASEFRDDLQRVLFTVNPRASREHLAEFLNFLFLGGPAPRPAEPLVAPAAPAPARTAAPEPDDAFSDRAPQTGTHPLMHASRLGDLLDEAVLLVRPVADSRPITTGAPTPIPGSMPAVQPPRAVPARLPAPEPAWENVESVQLITDAEVVAAVDSATEAELLASTPDPDADPAPSPATPPPVAPLATTPNMPAWQPPGAPTRSVPPPPVPAALRPSPAAGRTALAASAPRLAPLPLAPPTPVRPPGPAPVSRPAAPRPPASAADGGTDGASGEHVAISRWSVAAPAAPAAPPLPPAAIPDFLTSPTSSEGMVIDLNDSVPPKAPAPAVELGPAARASPRPPTYPPAPPSATLAHLSRPAAPPVPEDPPPAPRDPAVPVRPAMQASRNAAAAPAPVAPPVPGLRPPGSRPPLPTGRKDGA